MSTNTTNYLKDPLLQFKWVITFIIPMQKNYTIRQKCSGVFCKEQCYNEQFLTIKSNVTMNAEEYYWLT